MAMETDNLKPKFALSFYWSKTIMDSSKLFWINQKVLNSIKNMKVIFGPIQNNMDESKIVLDPAL